MAVAETQTRVLFGFDPVTTEINLQIYYDQKLYQIGLHLDQIYILLLHQEVDKIVNLGIFPSVIVKTKPRQQKQVFEAKL